MVEPTAEDLRQGGSPLEGQELDDWEAAQEAAKEAESAAAQLLEKTSRLEAELEVSRRECEQARLACDAAR
ncbi:MAG: hypothetical protein ACPIFP_08575, partial [Candidatus Poseidoniaceae archaeon]